MVDSDFIWISSEVHWEHLEFIQSSFEVYLNLFRSSFGVHLEFIRSLFEVHFEFI